MNMPKDYLYMCACGRILGVLAILHVAYLTEDAVAAPISLVGISNQAVRVRLGGDSGVAYYVRSTDDLAQGEWQLATTNSLASNEEVLLTTPSGDRAFWRAESDYEYRASLFIRNYERQLDAGGPVTLSINGQLTNNAIVIDEDRDAGQIVITGNGVPNYRPTVVGLDVTDGWNGALAGGFQSLKLSENNQGAGGGNNPNRVIVAQEVFRIPLDPVMNQVATETALGTVGVAVNGIPIYNPFEDQNQTAASGRIFSSCCGHPQLNGIYHYHKYPTCLKFQKGDVWQSEKEKCDELDALIEQGGHSPLIGFALDGWPVYGPVGWTDSNRVSKLLGSSYTGAADGAGNPSYVPDSGDLDDCGGLVSPTPEFPEGIYHYVMTIEASPDGSVLRYINPYFGYDIRNTLDKHGLKPAGWDVDNTYVSALKTGFSVGAITIPGTDSYSTFYDFVLGMVGMLESNGLSAVADEFETMKIAYPYTIRKYRGTPSNAGGGGGGGGVGGNGITSVAPATGLAGFAYDLTLNLQAPAGTPGLPPVDAPITAATVGGIALINPSRSSANTVTGQLVIPSGAVAGAMDATVSFSGPPGQPGPTLTGTGVFTVSVPAGAAYTDSAGAYASWSNGSNGGSGFGSWNLTSSGNAGFFIAEGNANLSVEFSKGFGLYANSGGIAEAKRDFAGALSTGDTFAISFDNNYITNGSSVGFSLLNESGGELLRFYFVGGEQNYRISDITSGRDSGIPYTDGGLVVRITIHQDSLYTLQAEGYTLQGTLAINQPVSGFEVQNRNAGPDDPHNLYFGRHSWWDVP